MAAVVSIILPTFNRLEFLRAAVESVLAQTFRDWELIVADDGSDDETLGYLSHVTGNAHAQLLRLEHSGNPPAVRNAALRCARGKLVAFLDSDDVWAPRKLECQLRALQSAPTRRWSYTGFAMVDAALRPQHGAVRFDPECGWIAAALLNHTTTIVQSSVMVYRDFIEQAGCYDESLPICGDYELWVRLATLGEVDCVGERLVFVRRHSQHYSNDVDSCRDFVRALAVIAGTQIPLTLGPELRRQRAIAAATLARSQVRGGRRLASIATLLSGNPHFWRYHEWWRLAIETVARAAAPPALRRAIRGSPVAGVPGPM